MRPAVDYPPPWNSHCDESFSLGFPGLQELGRALTWGTARRPPAIFKNPPRGRINQARAPLAGAGEVAEAGGCTLACIAAQ
jgi:hypothetical protein